MHEMVQGKALCVLCPMSRSPLLAPEYPFYPFQCPSDCHHLAGHFKVLGLGESAFYQQAGGFGCLAFGHLQLDAARGIGRDGDIKSMNIHGSILPRWRGAAPVQRAIEAGDAVTGITLMKMEAGLDTGPMILKAETAITETDTSATLFERLTEMGAELIVKALEAADTLTWEAQPEEGVTYAEKILKSEAPIDWSLPAAAVARRIRAFNPFPYATAVCKGETVKIRNAVAIDASGTPGQVLEVGHRLVVACGSGAIDCLELQRAGKPAMPAAAFVQSTGLTVGDKLQ